MAIVVTDDKHYKDIANQLRSQLGESSGLYPPNSMATAIQLVKQKGYDEGHIVGVAEGIEQGKKSEYDRFWDTYQDNGSQTSYNYAFYTGRWNDVNFRPKYDIRPSAAGASAAFHSCEITDLAGILQECGVILDTSNCNSVLQMFQSSDITHIPEIDATNANSLNYTFSCEKLITIDKLKVSENSTSYIMTFRNAKKLKNIVIEGSIVSSIDLHWSEALTLESAKSCLLCLKNFTGTGSEYSCTVSLHANTWALLDAEGNTAPGDITWAEYARDVKCWNI